MDRITKFVLDTHLAQLLIAMLIWSIIGYLAIAEKEIPQFLVYAGTAVISFWFGVQAGAKAIIATEKKNGSNGSGQTTALVTQAGQRQRKGTTMKAAIVFLLAAGLLYLILSGKFLAFVQILRQ
jgi:hypothetical protein